MKYLLLALGIFTTTVMAQNTWILKKSVVCADLDTIANVIREHKEKVQWYAKDASTENTVTLFLNSETLSWTLVESNKSVGCLLAAGEGYRTMPSGIPSNSVKKPSDIL